MQRWMGPFDTPNQAALVIACALTLVMSVAARQSDEIRSMHRWAIWTAGGAMLAAGTLLLAATGSRAGWLAEAGAIGALWRGGSIGWRWALASSVGLVIAVACWPGASGRAAEVVVDAATDDRLVLWSRSLAMVADHPWAGVGGGADFVNLLEAWYLPVGLSGRFATTLNDGTCCACFGIPFFAVVVALVAGVLLLGWRVRSSALAGAGSALLVALVIAGQFQAHQTSWTPRVIGLVALALITAGALRHRHANHAVAAIPTTRLATIAAGIGLLAGCLIAVVSMTVGRSAPWRTESIAGGIVATPRHLLQAPMAVILTDSGPSARIVQRLCAQQALSVGWALTVRQDQGLADIEVALQAVNRPAALAVAWQQSASLTWIHARQHRYGLPIVLVDPVEVPPAQSTDGQTPLLVVTSRSAAFSADPQAILEALKHDASGSRCEPIRAAERSERLWPMMMTWLHSLRKNW